MNLWIKLMNPLVEAFVERCVDGWRYLGISSWAIMLSRAADYTPQEVSSLFRSHDFNLVCFSVNLIPSVTFFCSNRSPRIAGKLYWHMPLPLLLSLTQTRPTLELAFNAFFPLAKEDVPGLHFLKKCRTTGCPKKRTFRTNGSLASDG